MSSAIRTTPAALSLFLLVCGSSAAFPIWAALPTTRINTTDQAITDTSGNVWQARNGFTGGWGMPGNAVDIAGTNDDALYRPEWAGMSAWAHAMPNGQYKVTLKLRESWHAAAGKRVFSVTAEGRPVIDNLDVFAQVGRDTAYDRSFNVTVADGRLDLAFSAAVDFAMVSAIAVEPVDVVPSGEVIRVSGAYGSVRDSAGNVWEAANGFSGGRSWTPSPQVPIAGTNEDALYNPEYVGMAAWSRAVANGRYEVTLKMREAWFGTANARVFDVSAEGAVQLTGIDIFAAAGKNTAYDRSFQVAVNDGVLNLGFVARQNIPLVSAIQVRKLDGSQAPPPPTALAADPVSSSAVTLRWDHSGTGVSKFEIRRNGTLIGETGARQYNVTGLAAGTTYVFAVRAIGGNGQASADASVSVTTPPAQTGMQELKVSVNGRYLVKNDGSPFVWLSDTAWALFMRSTREEAVAYLDTRKAQGFNVIQATAIFNPYGMWELLPNSYGALPINGTVANRNAAYWQHVDFVVSAAEARGLYVAMLPIWSDSSVNLWINAGNAQEYGQFLGSRYRNNKIIWVLGGDDKYYHRDVWRAVARGIAIGVSGAEDYSKVLMTYHPRARTDESTGSSSGAFHQDAWLDFNMAQSGHCGGPRSYDLTGYDYGLSPPKPTLDGEPYYEDHAWCWNGASGYAKPYEVRSAMYTGVFAGGFGVTYGNHAVWQMYAPGRAPITDVNVYWYDALTHQVAGQAKYLRRLLESRPVLIRVPDQSLITGDAKSGWQRLQATRGSDGSYAMVYTSVGAPFNVNLDKLAGQTAQPWWYNPRTGAASKLGAMASSGVQQFTPPSGEDWVLVLDNADSGYGTPGQ